MTVHTYTHIITYYNRFSCDVEREYVVNVPAHDSYMNSDLTLVSINGRSTFVLNRMRKRVTIARVVEEGIDIDDHFMLSVQEFSVNDTMTMKRWEKLIRSVKNRKISERKASERFGYKIDRWRDVYRVSKAPQVDYHTRKEAVDAMITKLAVDLGLEPPVDTKSSKGQVGQLNSTIIASITTSTY